MYVCVIDVGTRNFAMIVEKIPNAAVKTLKKEYDKLPKSQKIVEGRPHQPALEKLISEYTAQGKTILLELHDPNAGEKKGLQNSTRRNLHDFLKRHLETLKLCDYIRIEEQFYNPKDGIINKPALLLGESCYTWFLLHGFKDVDYTPSKLKTALLGCPKEAYKVDKNTGLRMITKYTKKDRKEWSVQFASKIYSSRGDDRMKGYKKGDDVADCLCMTISFVLKNFIM